MSSIDLIDPIDSGIMGEMGGKRERDMIRARTMAYYLGEANDLLLIVLREGQLQE